MLSANGRQDLERTWVTDERTDNSIRRDIVNFKRGECVGVNQNSKLRTSLGLGSCILRWLVVAGLLAWTAPARAEEPRTANEPRLMAELTEITQVADAFDDDNRFDVNLSLGDEYTSRSADILRESAVSTGLSARGNDKIAQYKESTHRLQMRADFGIYHDLALVVRMPAISAVSNSG